MEHSAKMNEAADKHIKAPVREALVALEGLTIPQKMTVTDIAKAYTMAFLLEGITRADVPPPAHLLKSISTKMQEALYKAGISSQLGEIETGIAESPEFLKAVQNWEGLLEAMIGGSGSLLKTVMEDPELEAEATAAGEELRRRLAGSFRDQ